MKQATFIKGVRFVQKPIQDCLFESPKVANLPFKPFVPIAEQVELIKPANLSTASLPQDKNENSIDLR